MSFLSKADCDSVHTLLGRAAWDGSLSWVRDGMAYALCRRKRHRAHARRLCWASCPHDGRKRTASSGTCKGRMGEAAAVQGGVSEVLRWAAGAVGRLFRALTALQVEDTGQAEIVAS